MKKKASVPVLTIYNKQGTVLRQCQITALSIGEQVVKEKSIEYFSDPEPCFLHKNAVLSRIYAEIRDWAEGLGTTGDTQIPFDEIPLEIKTYLILKEPADAAYLIVTPIFS